MEDNYTIILKKFTQLAQAVRVLSENNKKVEKLVRRLENVETKTAKNAEKINNIAKEVKASNKMQTNKIQEVYDYQKGKSNTFHEITDELQRKGDCLKGDISLVKEKISILDEECKVVKKSLKHKRKKIEETKFIAENLKGSEIEASAHIPNTQEYVFSNKCSCECAQCNKLHPPKGILKTPKVNLQTTDYLCSICGNRFSAKWLLENHVQLHSSQKHYPCNECGKSLFSNGD